jgi:hypothetical protein
MGKDVYHEQVEVDVDSKLQKYTIGTICRAKPKESYVVRHDGSLIPSRKSADENSFGINRRKFLCLIF